MVYYLKLDIKRKKGSLDQYCANFCSFEQKLALKKMIVDCKMLIGGSCDLRRFGAPNVEFTYPIPQCTWFKP